MEWRYSTETRPKKFKTQRSSGKVLATVFWDSSGVVLFDYLENGQNINSSYYSLLPPSVRENLKRNRRGKLIRGVMFLQDNAPAHRSRETMVKIDEMGFEILEHPHYSPDLAPSDYFLFPQLKKPSKVAILTLQMTS